MIYGYCISGVGLKFYCMRSAFCRRFNYFERLIDRLFMISTHLGNDEWLMIRTNINVSYFHQIIFVNSTASVPSKINRLLNINPAFSNDFTEAWFVCFIYAWMTAPGCIFKN